MIRKKFTLCTMALENGNVWSTEHVFDQVGEKKNVIYLTDDPFGTPDAIRKDRIGNIRICSGSCYPEVEMYIPGEFVTKRAQSKLRTALNGIVRKQAKEAVEKIREFDFT